MKRTGQGGQTNSSQSLWSASAGGGVACRGGGTMQTSFWQLLTPLTSYLEQTIVWDPHTGRRYAEFTLWMLKNWSRSSLLVAHMRRLWNAERSRVWEGGPSIFTPCQGEIHWLKKPKNSGTVSKVWEMKQNSFLLSFLHFHLNFLPCFNHQEPFYLFIRKNLSSPSFPVCICYKSRYTLKNMTSQTISA